MENLTQKQKDKLFLEFLTKKKDLKKIKVLDYLIKNSDRYGLTTEEKIYLSQVVWKIFRLVEPSKYPEKNTDRFC